MKMRWTIVALLPMVALTSAAMAGTYSGRWPMTVTHSQRLDGNYCVTLTDDGSGGWPHSGAASLAGQSFFGTFQLVEHSLLVTFEEPGNTGQNAGLVFIARVANGVVGNGATEQVYGGEDFDSGVLTVRAKGGC